MLPKNLSKNPFDHHVIFGFVILLFVVFSSAFANAETLTWTNNGGSGSWHDDTNWNPTQVPTDEDDVVYVLWCEFGVGKHFQYRRLYSLDDG